MQKEVVTTFKVSKLTLSTSTQQAGTCIATATVQTSDKVPYAVAVPLSTAELREWIKALDAMANVLDAQ